MTYFHGGVGYGRPALTAFRSDCNDLCLRPVGSGGHCWVHNGQMRDEAQDEGRLSGNKPVL